MRKLFAFILALTMVVSVGSPVLVSAEDTAALSEMSIEECIAFLKANGVEIPDELYTELEWGVFAKEIIAQVEEDPNVAFPFGYSVLLQFANDIRFAVIKYYNMDGNVYSVQAMEETSLQDNTVYGSWSDDYLNYNCYAYAIGCYDRIVNPGTFSNNAISMDTSISGIAGSVRTDLQALGYTVLSVSNTMPAVTVSDHTHLICVRKDVDGVIMVEGGMAILLKDYHFMRLGQDGNWYHKPGQTNPLRYKYTPSNDRIWVVESYDGESYDRVEGWTYDSEIYFIGYTTPHTYEYAMCGNEQHILTCTICGQTTGSASACVYVNDYCTSCGRHDHNLGLADRTGNHYHEGLLHYFEYSRVCQDCGAYVYHWESEVCSGPPCMVPGLSLQPEELIS